MNFSFPLILNQLVNIIIIIFLQNNIILFSPEFHFHLYNISMQEHKKTKILCKILKIQASNFCNNGGVRKLPDLASLWEFYCPIATTVTLELWRWPELEWFSASWSIHGVFLWFLFGTVWCIVPTSSLPIAFSKTIPSISSLRRASEAPAFSSFPSLQLSSRKPPPDTALNSPNQNYCRLF